MRWPAGTRSAVRRRAQVFSARTREGGVRASNLERGAWPWPYGLSFGMAFGLRQPPPGHPHQVPVLRADVPVGQEAVTGGPQDLVGQHVGAQFIEPAFHASRPVGHAAVVRRAARRVPVTVVALQPGDAEPRFGWKGPSNGRWNGFRPESSMAVEPLKKAL